MALDAKMDVVLAILQADESAKSQPHAQVSVACGRYQTGSVVWRSGRSQAQEGMDVQWIGGGGRAVLRHSGAAAVCAYHTTSPASQGQPARAMSNVCAH